MGSKCRFRRDTRILQTFSCKSNEYGDNIDVSEILTLEQKSFFERLGIDVSKVMVERHLIPENEEETQFSKLYMIRALFCGDLRGIPQYQEEFYFGSYDEDDEPLFPMYDEMDIIVSDDMESFFEEMYGMGIAFSHPLPFLAIQGEENIDEKYKQWFCGECFAKVIIKK